MSTEALCDSMVKLGLAKKGRFKLMRTWSFHGKSERFETIVTNVSTGSLDGDSTGSPSRRAQLCDSGMDTPDSLDRKTFKIGEKSAMSGSKLSKRDSLKEKKKNYRSQKKEVAREIMNSASDQSFVLMSDWLKLRGTLKGWTKLWCVCKPSMLIIYKSEKMKTGHWVGTVLLNTCQLLQRPSKKEGFCFKLFHPLDQSIWSTKGPKGETIGAFVQPLPMSYAIFRAPSENIGKCWMDGLELALRCTSLIKKTTSRSNDITSDLSAALASDLNSSLVDDADEAVEECEIPLEHFSDDDDHSSIGMSDSDFELAEEEGRPQDVPKVEETVYICNEVEELGQQGDACQTEEVNEENKSLIWTLVKQVRPGMDLSKVVLPTFILEPRSFLDKLTDYYYHADILTQAVQQETALERMKMVVKWYLSGFYKKPKGLKKPYNPIIGETFRCYWVHPESNSRTFYVAEQISHHPPISAFHVTNRHDGFSINGCILAKSKFYGNSISAILEGSATLTFLERGEDYVLTMPYAHCKGILLGTLTMEMGGKVTLDCLKTGYHCDLDFKLKPFFGNGESANRITGCIRMGSEVLCTFEGHWDQQIYIKELTNREKVVFWDASPETRARRLKRYTVPVHLQKDSESERLWEKVSEAVIYQDMHQATAEKHKLEEAQRIFAKERLKNKQEWAPKYFTLDETSTKWIYIHVDARPWDLMTDRIQYEKDYVIQTQTVHNVPQVWQAASTITQGRIGAYNTHSVMVTDDSYSSDNTAAESDDARCHDMNPMSYIAEVTVNTEDPRSRQHKSCEKNFLYASHDSSKASPKSPRPKSVFSHNNNEETKSSTPEQVRKHMVSGLLNNNRSSGGTDRDSSSKQCPAEMFNSSLQASLETSSPDSGRSAPFSSTPTTQKAARTTTAVDMKRQGELHHHHNDGQTLNTILEMQREMQSVLAELVTKVASVQKCQDELLSSGQPLNVVDGAGSLGIIKNLLLITFMLVFHTILQWALSRAKHHNNLQNLTTFLTREGPLTSEKCPSQGNTAQPEVERDHNPKNRQHQCLHTSINLASTPPSTLPPHLHQPCLHTSINLAST